MNPSGTFEGRALVAGEAHGPVLVLVEPLSFWGGVDPASGRLIDTHHPQLGADLAGQVVVMPGGRGSSSSSSVLAEAIRNGVAPAALILAEPDAILALGCVVAQELYHVTVPVVVVTPETYQACAAAREITVEAGPGRTLLRCASANPAAEV